MVLNIKKVMLLPLKRKIKIITHRIIGVKDTNGKVMYETKGDNNNGPDLEPVLAENVVGKYADITVPYVGYLLNYANSKAGAALLLIIPGVFCLVIPLFLFLVLFVALTEKRKIKSRTIRLVRLVILSV